MSITKPTKDIRKFKRDRLALLSILSRLVHEANDMKDGGIQLYVSIRSIRHAERVIKRVTGPT